MKKNKKKEIDKVESDMSDFLEYSENSSNNDEDDSFKSDCELDLGGTPQHIRGDEDLFDSFSSSEDDIEEEETKDRKAQVTGDVASRAVTGSSQSSANSVSPLTTMGVITQPIPRTPQAEAQSLHSSLSFSRHVPTSRSRSITSDSNNYEKSLVKDSLVTLANLAASASPAKPLKSKSQPRQNENVETLRTKDTSIKIRMPQNDGFKMNGKSNKETNETSPFMSSQLSTENEHKNRQSSTNHVSGRKSGSNLKNHKHTPVPTKERKHNYSHDNYQSDNSSFEYTNSDARGTPQCRSNKNYPSVNKRQREAEKNVIVIQDEFDGNDDEYKETVFLKEAKKNINDNKLKNNMDGSQLLSCFPPSDNDESNTCDGSARTNKKGKGTKKQKSKKKSETVTSTPTKTKAQKQNSALKDINTNSSTKQQDSGTEKSNGDATHSNQVGVKRKKRKISHHQVSTSNKNTLSQSSTHSSTSTTSRPSPIPTSLAPNSSIKHSTPQMSAKKEEKSSTPQQTKKEIPSSISTSAPVQVKSEPKKKKITFQTQILTHLLTKLKPFTIKSLATDLRTTDVALHNLMLSLIDKKIIMKKEFVSNGAKKRLKELYWVDIEHASLELNKNQHISNVGDQGVEAAKEELKHLVSKERQLRKEVEELNGQISIKILNERLEKEERILLDMKERIAGAKARISGDTSSTSNNGTRGNNSCSSTKQVKIEINRMRDEWKSRKEKCTDFVYNLADAMEKKTKDVNNLLEIETDEMMGISLPPKHIIEK